MALKDVCEIRLEDSNTGELFAACHVHPGKRETTVESVSDSSRYFVLRIDDGQGKHAFIGLGFAERNEAFDFNVALSDHEKYIKREEKGENEEDTNSELHPSLDLKLKEGETIRINVKTKPASNSGMMSLASGGAAIASTGRMKAPLAPPPGGGRLRSPLPPPPNDTKHLRVSTATPLTRLSGATASTAIANTDIKRESGRPSGDPFADLSQLEASLPPSMKSGTTSNKTSHAGWAAF